MAEWPARGQQAPDYWDDMLKTYIDESTRAEQQGISGVTQTIPILKDTVLTGSLSADAVITLAFGADVCSVMAFINPSGHQLTWGGQTVTGTDEVALSCVFDGTLAHYMVSGVVVTSVTPPAANLAPPTNPSTLVVSGITATKATLTWNTSDSDVGVDYYNLSTNGGTTVVHQFPNTDPFATDYAYEFVGLTPSTAYSLAVQAVDGQGAASAWVTVPATTSAGPIRTAPAAPTGLAAPSRTSTSVTLTWNAVTGTAEYPVVGYRVSKDNGATWVTESVPAGTLTYTVTGLVQGVSHTFVVQAGDSVGWGASSNSVITSAQGFTDESVLSWDFDEGAGLTAAATAGGADFAIPSGSAYLTSWPATKNSYGLKINALNVVSAAVLPAPLDTTLWAGITVMLWTNTAAGYTYGGFVAGGAYVNGSAGAPNIAVPIFEFGRDSSTNDGNVDRIISRLQLADPGDNFKCSHQLITTITPVASNAFTHYAFTWNATTGVWRNYINGTEVGTQTQAGVLKSHRTPTFPSTLVAVTPQLVPEAAYAAPYVANHEKFDSGIKDDLRVIPRALTAAEIVTYMNEPVA